MPLFKKIFKTNKPAQEPISSQPTTPITERRLPAPGGSQMFVYESDGTLNTRDIDFYDQEFRRCEPVLQEGELLAWTMGSSVPRIVKV